MNEALGCVTPGRLFIPGARRIETGLVYALVLNAARPVRLPASVPLLFSAGHKVRIERTATTAKPVFDAQTVEYWYRFATTDEREIVAFHWTPETVQPGERRYPHLHVGSVMLSERTPVLPGRFNNAHIPTGLVSLAAVIRFGIEESGVRRLRQDWERVLEDGE